MFPHRSIHKYIWTSPDGQRHNQIDHVLIDRRRNSSIFYVRSFRGADFDTDHYLVAAKTRKRLAVSKRAVNKTDMDRFNLNKLNEVEVKEQYQFSFPEDGVGLIPKRGCLLTLAYADFFSFTRNLMLTRCSLLHSNIFRPRVRTRLYLNTRPLVLSKAMELSLVSRWQVRTCSITISLSLPSHSRFPSYKVSLVFFFFFCAGPRIMHSPDDMSLESDGGMIYWQRKTEKLGEKLSQCHFIHRKSHMDWPGRESGSLRWEGGD
jgi:hypothetical protein